MAKRPNIENFFDKKTTITKINNILSENKELYNYINALNSYIDELEQLIDYKTLTAKDKKIETISKDGSQKNNFVAVYKFGYPIGVDPGDWEVATKIKLCNEQTTIKEIYDWYKSKMPEDKFRCEITEAD